MSAYQDRNRESLLCELEALRGEYAAAQAKKLSLDMSRGKPGGDQLDLSMPLLDVLDVASDMKAQDGSESRNYGVLEGIPEARKLMADLLEVEPGEVFVGGNSSLALMYDCVSYAYIHGLPESDAPWGKQEHIKFLCPSPGYDRHFTLTAHFGFELVPVPMTAQGPDMDEVERQIQAPCVKGIWNVPKYSNPQGITYSDEVVRRFAALSPAAKDFRIFWDNAYAVHHLNPEKPDRLLSLMGELKKTGKENMAFLFSSTSKVTFPGAGIAAAAMSAENLKWFVSHKFFQTIGYDKINQLRHTRWLPDLAAVEGHMAKHAEILRPKFQAVLDTLETLRDFGVASWNSPNGGYFISLDVMPGCAKRVVQLCKEAGVVMTGAGATWPYGKDPEDKNIRIAPTLPPIQELRTAMELLCLCVKIAALEKLTV